MAGRRVVVTGIGTINPLGHSVEEYFSNLEAGVSAAAPITRFDATKFRSRIACEVKDYDWTQYFDRKEVRKYDLFAQFAMISAECLPMPLVTIRRVSGKAFSVWQWFRKSVIKDSAHS